jgi:hypothetical protein
MAAGVTAHKMAERMATMPYDRAMTLRGLQGISENAVPIALSDERAAEQAAMAVDSLYIAYSKDTKPANDAEVRSAINALFQQLENPSAYNADQFAAALRRVGPMVR